MCGTFAAGSHAGRQYRLSHYLAVACCCDGLLLWAQRAGDTDRQWQPPGAPPPGTSQLGIQQHTQAVSCYQMMYEAEHRLVTLYCAVGINV